MHRTLRSTFGAFVALCSAGSALWPLAGLVVSVALVHVPAAAAQSLRFELEVAPKSGNLSDTFVATVHIEAAGLGTTKNYRHPKLDGFAISNKRHAHTRSTQIDTTSGRQNVTVDTWVYVLRPLRAGRLSVGPARVDVQGRTRRTRIASIDVNDPGGLSARDPTAGGKIGAPGFRPPSPRTKSDFFLHAVTDKTRVFVGEQVVVTWLIYTKTADIRLSPHPPRLTGLWSETLQDASVCCRYHNGRVGGKNYLVSILEKRAVFPTRAGEQEVSAYSAEITDQRPGYYRRVSVSSPPVTLRVEPLPAGAPPGFDPSYVGEFEAEASVDRAEVDAGQSITLTLVVKGKGAVRRTNAPTLDFPGFRFRTPRDFTEKISASNDAVTGERSYRYWATPERGGKQTIPAVRIPFFNPATRRYEVAETTPISIAVKGDPKKLGARPVASGAELAQRIRPSRGGTSITSGTGTPLHTRGWYWLLAALPLLGFAGVLTRDVVRWRAARRGSEGRAKRARSGHRKRFKRARSYLESQQVDAFYGELAVAITDRLEGRVGEPLGGLTRAQLLDLLGQRGFDAETIAAISNELTTCDIARFASSASTPEEMEASLERARQLIDLIESAPLAGEDLDAHEDDS